MLKFESLARILLPVAMREMQIFAFFWRLETRAPLKFIVISYLVAGGCGASFAASQGQVGSVSIGSVAIALTKTATLQINSEPVPARLVGPSALKLGERQMALCIAAQEVSALELGVVAGQQIQPLSALGETTVSATCPGQVQHFAVPDAHGRAGDAEPVVTLIAGPI
jgi:peptidoglycan biosynthesis protein MviN/MurJ (putative lipid II flippase)